LRALSLGGSGVRGPLLVGGASIQSSRLGAAGSAWEVEGRAGPVVARVGAVPGRAGPQSSSESESGSGLVVGRSERGAGGGAGPRTRLGGSEGPEVVRGGAGPVASSDSESSAISSLLDGPAAGGREGPIGCFLLAGAVVLWFATVGGSEGPIVGLGREAVFTGPLLLAGVGPLGPKLSAESSSREISSSFPRREVLDGGEPGSASSSGVRLRFWRCGGSCGPIDAIALVVCLELQRLLDCKWSCGC
jgi:hypothetical protein